MTSLTKLKLNLTTLPSYALYEGQTIVCEGGMKLDTKMDTFNVAAIIVPKINPPPTIDGETLKKISMEKYNSAPI